MIDISLNNIKKNFGFDILFDDLSLEVKHGEHVGIVGDNGCGKSTLLNIISGDISIDKGSIAIRKNTKIGYLRQIPDNLHVLVKDILYQGLEDIIKLKEKLDKLENELISSNYSDKIINEYCKLQEEFINNKGLEIESKIGKIIDIFNINKDLLNKYFDNLSGGEKTIISFASILLNEPDILLLDEPTNHLDINMLEILENYLNKLDKTIIIVSHDRYFLDKVVNKILYINKHKVNVFHGNYTYYINELEKLKELEIKEYNDQVKQIDKMEKSIKQLREFGRIGDDSRFFKRANSIEKRLDKMDKLDKPLEKFDIPLSFNINDRSGNDVITIKDFDLKINDYCLIKDININVHYLDHVCIMGSNGCGKSTLIKEIINNPNIKIGSNTNIGYIPQEIKFANEKLRVLEEVRKYYIGSESNLRSGLAKFYFKGENVFKRLESLSGGERLRLKLFCIMQGNYNVLILDEVTNHIDIDTKELLESALNNYQGTIIFISHDRYFINKVASKILYIKDNKIKEYIGNYDDFKDYIEK